MSSIDIEAARQYYYRRELNRQVRREAQRQQWLRRVGEAVSDLALLYPGVRRVYLFGSLVQLGRFRPDSDIDVAVECDTLESESAFWRALEQELKRAVDVRPLAGVIATVALNQGEQIYGPQDSNPAE